MRSERITISIRPQLVEWLRTRANESGRSLSSEIEWSLEQYCTERLKEGMQNMVQGRKK